MNNGTVQTVPRLLLQLEGAALLGSSLAAYHYLGARWWLFGALFLAPDLGMVGFLRNSTLGSITYNVVHTETPPIILLAVAYGLQRQTLAAVALTWLSHIGLDRMIGAGLKYCTGFGHTHLGLMGEAKKAAKRTERGSS